jgi:hypothetical protein
LAGGRAGEEVLDILGGDLVAKVVGQFVHVVVDDPAMALEAGAPQGTGELVVVTAKVEVFLFRELEPFFEPSFCVGEEQLFLFHETEAVGEDEFPDVGYRRKSLTWSGSEGFKGFVDLRFAVGFHHDGGLGEEGVGFVVGTGLLGGEEGFLGVVEGHRVGADKGGCFALGRGDGRGQLFCLGGAVGGDGMGEGVAEVVYLAGEVGEVAL